MIVDEAFHSHFQELTLLKKGCPGYNDIKLYNQKTNKFIIISRKFYDFTRRK